MYIAGTNVSDRTNSTIHQATLCVKISLQHDSCPNCNVQHSFQPGCQVTVLLVEPVKFSHGSLAPLLCTSHLVDLIQAENTSTLPDSNLASMSVELFAWETDTRVTDRTAEVIEIGPEYIPYYLAVTPCSLLRPPPYFRAKLLYRVFYLHYTPPPPQAARAGLRYCSSCTCTRVASVEELYLCIKRVENSLRTGLGLFR